MDFFDYLDQFVSIVDNDSNKAPISNQINIIDEILQFLQPVEKIERPTKSTR